MKKLIPLTFLSGCCSSSTFEQICKMRYEEKTYAMAKCLARYDYSFAYTLFWMILLMSITAGLWILAWKLHEEEKSNNTKSEDCCSCMPAIAGFFVLVIFFCCTAHFLKLNFAPILIDWK